MWTALIWLRIWTSKEKFLRGTESSCSTKW